MQSCNRVVCAYVHIVGVLYQSAFGGSTDVDIGTATLLM